MWESVPLGLASIMVILCALVMLCRRLPTSTLAASGVFRSQRHQGQRILRQPLQVALHRISPRLSEGGLTLEQLRLFAVLLSVCVTKFCFHARTLQVGKVSLPCASLFWISLRSPMYLEMGLTSWLAWGLTGRTSSLNLKGLAFLRVRFPIMPSPASDPSSGASP